MSSKHNDHRDFEQLDEAIGHSTHKLFNMSPNDVLVQISLPVVLILAIATRLITIGQGISTQSQNQAVLDLWKQHLILRVDRTLDNWERKSGLPQFSDFGRVYWDGLWPRDDSLSQLCQKARDLADLEKMKDSLYREALTSTPAATDTVDPGGINGTIMLYDPRYAAPGTASNSVPPEYHIDDVRRQYAFHYIEERCKRWTREVETLQWKLIDHLASAVPAGDALTDPRLDVQMKNITTALEKRGYPLLPGISHEYGKGQVP